jgi:hypothetical protein
MLSWANAGQAVVNVYINYEKKFAFVEFRTGATLFQPPAPSSLLAAHGICVDLAQGMLQDAEHFSWVDESICLFSRRASIPWLYDHPS